MRGTDAWAGAAGGERKGWWVVPGRFVRGQRTCGCRVVGGYSEGGEGAGGSRETPKGETRRYWRGRRDKKGGKGSYLVRIKGGGSGVHSRV